MTKKNKKTTIQKLPGPPRPANGVYDKEGNLLAIRPLPGDPPVVRVDLNDWADYKNRYGLKVINILFQPHMARPLVLVRSGGSSETEESDPDNDQGLPDYIQEA